MKQRIFWLTAWLVMIAGNIWKLMTVTELTLTSYRIMVISFILVALVFIYDHAKEIYKLKTKRRH